MPSEASPHPQSSLVLLLLLLLLLLGELRNVPTTSFQDNNIFKVQDGQVNASLNDSNFAQS